MKNRLLLLNFIIIRWRWEIQTSCVSHISTLVSDDNFSKFEPLMKHAFSRESRVLMMSRES